MGEYAEMMLDGTCCAGCGEFLFDDDPMGIPQYCSPECAPEGHPLRKSKTPVPHTFTTQAARNCFRRLEKKGFAVTAYTDFHFRVMTKDGCPVDYWPTAGRHSYGKWREVGANGKANQCMTSFWKRLNRPAKPLTGD